MESKDFSSFVVFDATTKELSSFCRAGSHEHAHCDLPGDTFTSPDLKRTMTTMHVPDPVISLSIKPEKTTDIEKFGKALARFSQQVPNMIKHTYRAHDRGYHLCE